jgi:hypothetical protein
MLTATAGGQQATTNSNGNNSNAFPRHGALPSLKQLASSYLPAQGLAQQEPLFKGSSSNSIDEGVLLSIVDGLKSGNTVTGDQSDVMSFTDKEADPKVAEELFMHRFG